jgi:hypothetical protein
MSTPVLNKTDDAIATTLITPTNVFVNSKVKQGKIYCQECLKATGKLIPVTLTFIGDRAIFDHDNCVICPSTPNPFPLEVVEIPEIATEIVEIPEVVHEIAPEVVEIVEIATEVVLPKRMVYVEMTSDGWTWDPPSKNGERCAIVHKYLNDWIEGKKGTHFPKKIRADYKRAGFWNENVEMILQEIHDDETATIKSTKGEFRRVPLGTLWTLESNRYVVSI